MDTRERLIDRAKELFNEQGLEAVGVRDLARDLDLSPGNVSYYFARKEHLIEELMAELARENADNVAALASAGSLSCLLDRYRAVFTTQYDYRFLARSVVHIVETYPAVGSRYSSVDSSRRRGLAEAFERLVGTDLQPDTTSTSISAIVGTCTLIARFWLSEMRLSFQGLERDAVIDHYVAIIAHSTWSAATPEARMTLQPYLDRVLPAAEVFEPRR